MTTDRWSLERDLWQKGYARVAGVDEVARAAWAGPMIAATVMFDREHDDFRFRSSKRMKPSSRVRAYELIKERATSVSIHQVSPDEINAEGIDRAHMRLLRESVLGLHLAPDLVLVDHYEIPDLKIPQRCIDDGDDLSFSIAAASILAKVECDRVMARYAERYPVSLVSSGTRDTELRSTSRRSDD